MRRDMDLIRKLLLHVEGAEPPDVREYRQEQQTYHYALIVEAGLAHGTVFEGEEGEPINVAITRLTWKGHEFLDDARSNTVWQRTRKALAETGVTVSLVIMRELLQREARQFLGLDP